MRTGFFAVLIGAGVLLGCNDPFQQPSGAMVRQDSISTPVFTGTPGATVVSVHGTVKNVGTLVAHQVTVTVELGSESIANLTNPSDIAPGETASWSAKMAGSQAPAVYVSWK